MSYRKKTRLDGLVAPATTVAPLPPATVPVPDVGPSIAVRVDIGALVRVPVSRPGHDDLLGDPLVTTGAAGIAIAVVDDDLTLNFHQLHDLNLDGLDLMLLLAAAIAVRLMKDRSAVVPMSVLDVHTDVGSATPTVVDVDTEAGAEAALLDVDAETIATDGDRRMGVREPLSIRGAGGEENQPEYESEDCSNLSHALSPGSDRPEPRTGKFLSQPRPVGLNYFRLSRTYYLSVRTNEKKNLHRTLRLSTMQEAPGLVIHYWYLLERFDRDDFVFEN